MASNVENIPSFSYDYEVDDDVDDNFGDVQRLLTRAKEEAEKAMANATQEPEIRRALKLRDQIDAVLSNARSVNTTNVLEDELLF